MSTFQSFEIRNPIKSYRKDGWNEVVIDDEWSQKVCFERIKELRGAPGRVWEVVFYYEPWSNCREDERRYYWGYYSEELGYGMLESQYDWGGQAFDCVRAAIFDKLLYAVAA